METSSLSNEVTSTTIITESSQPQETSESTGIQNKDNEKLNVLKESNEPDSGVVEAKTYFEETKGNNFDFFDDDEEPVRPLTKRDEFLNILCDAPEKMIIVVYYYVNWAGKCKSMRNFFYGLAEMYRNKALFYDINLDKADPSFKSGIYTLPCIKFYKGSFQIDAVQTHDEALIQFRMETYLDGKKPNGSYIV